MDLAPPTGWSRFAPKTSSGTRDRTPKYRGRPNRISEGRDITKNWQPTQEGSIASNVFPKRAFLGTSKRNTRVAPGRRSVNTVAVTKPFVAPRPGCPVSCLAVKSDQHSKERPVRLNAGGAPPDRANFRRKSSMTNRLVLIAALTLAAGVAPTHAQAPTADMVLINGKVITLDDTSSILQGIAIRDGRGLAVGADEDIRKRADSRTKIIDLGGRTVVPGLMDSHIHALRAGLTYAVELSWIGVPSLANGIDLLREAARSLPPGAWIKIGGGWTEMQFPEQRGPTVAELVAAAPDRPVYVQRLYNTAWITQAGIKLMKLTPDSEIPGGKAEKDASGNLTGVFTGVNRTFNFFTAKIPEPTFEQQLDG